ncbi:hypothetical protein [Lysobacter antibioticus]|uniref:hypothetical protein n=1 Tax=Lysobacter antibioticus TaxID=84531 RepID=UPI00113FDD35|nr:hypothetical protein [Lysobacter antibioticus]
MPRYALDRPNAAMIQRGPAGAVRAAGPCAAGAGPAWLRLANSAATTAKAVAQTKAITEAREGLRPPSSSSGFLEVHRPTGGLAASIIQ